MPRIPHSSAAQKLMQIMTDDPGGVKFNVSKSQFDKLEAALIDIAEHHPKLATDLARKIRSVYTDGEFNITGFKKGLPSEAGAIHNRLSTMLANVGDAAGSNVPPPPLVR